MIDISAGDGPEEISTMPDYEDFYAFGLPIETELGNFYSLRVKDYPSYALHLQIMQLTKGQIIQNYRKLSEGEEVEKLLEELGKLSLFQIVSNDQTLKHSYNIVFNKCFNREYVLHDIHDDEKLFEYCRKLVLKTNVLKEEHINPNPEIQSFIERSKKAKSQGQEKFTLSDMISSVVMISGVGYQEIMGWTMYQLHTSFYRAAKVMNYNTSTLFSTVSTEKVEITAWNGHIDLFEEDKHAIGIKELGKIASQIE